jgi:dimethylargininase
VHSLDDDGIVTAARRFGGQSMTRPLRRVLVRAPDTVDFSAWREYGWDGAPDPSQLAREHEAFCTILADAGGEVVPSEAPVPGDPDAIYVFDPAIVCDDGAILLCPGKSGRRGEPSALERDLDRADVPIVARLEAPAFAEGGDTLWLDERTLLVGRGYRTTSAGIAALGAALPDVDVVSFDLPYLHGPTEVLHLLSLLSPLDDDLVVAYLPLMPVALVKLLREREIRVVAVPDEEFATMGPNVLALAPRVALALEGNDVTRRRLEGAGVDVAVYGGDEISRRGFGGPTCLTRPLLRD